MTARRHLRAVVTLATAAALAAGCAGVPDSGDVRIAEGAGADAQARPPIALVSPPAPGASPTEIVAGFLAANAVPTDDYAVARTFLSPEVQETWNPDAGAIVYDDAAARLAARNGSAVTLAAQEIGRIDAAFSYRPAEAGTALVQPFTLRRTDGEWRILELRDGLLLTGSDLARAYIGLDAYYLNPQRSALVPDRLLLARDRAGLATTLVRRLLAGPSEWLAPGVVSAFPTGTEQAIDAAPVQDGVVTIDLTDDVLAASDAVRRQLAAQIVWTVTEIPGITGARITVAGQPLAISATDEIVTRATFSALDPDVIPDATAPYALVDGRLTVLTDPPAPVPGVLGSDALDPRVVAVATGRDEGTVALTEAPLRRTLYQAAFDAQAGPRPRPGVIDARSLSYDVTGTVVAVDSGGSILSLPPGTGAAAPVRAGVRGGVVQVAMARDGARAAVIVQSGSERRLLLARVERGSAGQITLAGLRRLESALSTASSVAWIDADRLAIIGVTTGNPTVVELTVGGPDLVSRGGVAGMRRIAAAPGSPLLVESGGIIWASAGSGWGRLAAGTFPVFAG